MGGTQARHNRDQFRTRRQRRRETDPEPLPPYEARATSQLVRPTDVSYDAPAAFELAEEIAVAQRASVAPSMAAAVSRRGQLPLMKRMAEVQRALNELNKLAAETPADGYPPHSIQALKMAQLKQKIALMSDQELERDAGHQSGRDLERRRREGPSGTPLPEPNTLHARMVEVQQLLTEVDRIMGQPASLETSMQLQSLRIRIAELAEGESTPGPSSSSAGPSIPEPVHLATVGHQVGSSQRDVLDSGTSQSGVAEGGGEAPTGSSAIPGPRELPPPYRAVTRDSTDDCAGPGATSVR